MTKKKVWRYYCEYCKKANCSGGSIAKHEKHCTMNPNRKCRMCAMFDNPTTSIDKMLAILPDPNASYERPSENEWMSFDGLGAAVEKVMPKLREITGGCPACILAALRQKGIPVRAIYSFNFKQEVNDWWSSFNQDQM